MNVYHPRPAIVRPIVITPAMQDARARLAVVVLPSPLRLLARQAAERK